MLMNGENCTDNTDYTDADERRELYGSHGKTRMQMNKDSVRSVESVQNKTAPRNTRKNTDADEQNIRSIR